MWSSQRAKLSLHLDPMSGQTFNLGSFLQVSMLPKNMAPTAATMEVNQDGINYSSCACFVSSISPCDYDGTSPVHKDSS